MNFKYENKLEKSYIVFKGNTITVDVDDVK